MMGFFDFLQGPNINKGLEEYVCEPGAVLLDVRTPQEYSEGHIPGSKNVPYQRMESVSAFAENKDVPLFVYCHCGTRSFQAADALEHMGYTHVRNLGGISAYLGRVER